MKQYCLVLLICLLFFAQMPFAAADFRREAVLGTWRMSKMYCQNDSSRMDDSLYRMLELLRVFNGKTTFLKLTIRGQDIAGCPETMNVYIVTDYIHTGPRVDIRVDSPRVRIPSCPVAEKQANDALDEDLELDYMFSLSSDRNRLNLISPNHTFLVLGRLGDCPVRVEEWIRHDEEETLPSQ